MSLDLDDETREMLGWNSPRPGDAYDREDRLSPTRLGGNPSRIAPGDIDGRSKARNRAAMSAAYWARKAAA